MNSHDSFSAAGAPLSQGAASGPSLDKTAPAIPAASVPLADFPAPDAPVSAAPIAPPYSTSTASASSGAPSAPASVADEAQAQSLISARNSGANWFFWIVGLSVLNTLISLTGTEWGFSLGAAATQIADVFAGESGSFVGRVFALGFDVLVFGFYVMCGVQAMRGATWAFVLGLVVFALDTLLMAVAQEWIGLALHAWAMFSIFTGLMANNNLKKWQAAQVAANAPHPWSG